MGIETKFSTNPSMVLGAIDPGVTPLEMAHAYETIATGGERVGGNLDASPGPNNAPADLAPSRSTRSRRPNGDTVAENHPKKIRVLSESVANEMKTILHANILGGTGEARPVRQQHRVGQDRHHREQRRRLVLRR